QQRVAMARALAPKPSLILADEPTGNLDETTGAGVMDLLFTLKQRTGATLLLITHDRALARRCDRIVALTDGRISGATARRRAAASCPRPLSPRRLRRAASDSRSPSRLRCVSFVPAQVGSLSSCCASRSA